MLTVQEIQAMSFEKAVFGGYDMKTVDEFIEQVTEDYAALQKENAALKSKMKVLVDKIEEYKSVEDGMRRALVSAQNIAQETIDTAKKEAEEILNTAKADADAQMKSHHAKLDAEKQELSRIRQETAEFISKMTGNFEKQMHSLIELSTSHELVDEKLSGLTVGSVESQPKIPVGQYDMDTLEKTRDLSHELNTPEVVKPQESTYTIPEDIRQFMQQQMDSNNEGMKIKVMEVTLDNQEQKDTDDATKSFKNLKFGTEYSAERDR